MTKPVLQKTRLNFKRREIVDHVKVAVIEDILVVAELFKVLGTMTRTSLEWEMPPSLLVVEFIALMEYGWLIVANVIPGVALPMLTPLVFIIPPF